MLTAPGELGQSLEELLKKRATQASGQPGSGYKPNHSGVFNAFWPSRISKSSAGFCS
jgi:hypothetical protein